MYPGSAPPPPPGWKPRGNQAPPPPPPPPEGLAQVPVPPAAPPSSVPGSAARPKRRRGIFALFIALGLLLIAGGATVVVIVNYSDSTPANRSANTATPPADDNDSSSEPEAPTEPDSETSFSDLPETSPADAFFAWGYGVGTVADVENLAEGQIPGDWLDDPTKVATKPGEVQLPQAIAHRKFVQIASGYAHNLALTDTGRVWFWPGTSLAMPGSASDLVLPEKSFEVDVPFTDDTEKIIDIAAGATYSLALSNTGQIYSWGWGAEGVLGDGVDYDVYDLDDHYSPDPDRVFARYEPENITAAPEFSDIKFTQIAAGMQAAFALDDDGNLYGWGIGYTGMLGPDHELEIPEADEFAQIATTDHFLNQPVKIADSKAFGGQKIHEISAGARHVAVLTDSQEIFTWGTGRDGQLGDGGTYSGGYGIFPDEDLGGQPHTTTPVQPQFPEDAETPNFVQVCSGTHFSLALSDHGEVYGWGNNRYGELASQELETSNTPIEIALKNPVSHIACGYTHAHALDDSGTLWSWGAARFWSDG